MAAGDLACTLVGSYATLAEAVAAIDADNLPVATDTIQILQLPPNGGQPTFAVIKTVRAAA